jgi:hypothetical protein
MAKSKTQVRHLTLALVTNPGEVVGAGNQDKHEEEDHRMLQREQMATATDISLLAGQVKYQSPHVHGVEQVKGSKFWAIGDDYSNAESTYSSDESDEEDEASSQALANEAFKAGFTIDQLRQAEAELDTPTTGTSKVRPELQEGSISMQIVDAWVTNRRKQGNPWRGTLPKQSPTRTLGDAIAKAKIVDHQKAMPLNSRYESSCLNSVGEVFYSTTACAAAGSDSG